MDVQLDFSTVIDCYARGMICTGFMHCCMYVQTFYAECRVIFFLSVSQCYNLVNQIKCCLIVHENSVN